MALEVVNERKYSMWFFSACGYCSLALLRKRGDMLMTLQLIVLAVEIVALIWMIPILIKVNKIDRDLKAMNDRLGGEE